MVVRHTTAAKIRVYLLGRWRLLATTTTGSTTAAGHLRVVVRVMVVKD